LRNWRGENPISSWRWGKMIPKVSEIYPNTCTKSYLGWLTSCHRGWPFQFSSGKHSHFNTKKS
jgi:hypothetical protein